MWYEVPQRLSRVIRVASHVRDEKQEYREIHLDVNDITHEDTQALSRVPIRIGELCVRADTPTGRLDCLPLSFRQRITSVRIDAPAASPAVEAVRLADVRVIFPSVSRIHVATPCADMAALLGVTEGAVPTELTVELLGDTVVRDIPNVVKITLIDPTAAETPKPVTVDINDMPHLVSLVDVSTAIQVLFRLRDLPLLEEVPEVTAERVELRGLPKVRSLVADVSQLLIVKSCAALESIVANLGESEIPAVLLETLPGLLTLRVNSAGRLQRLDMEDIAPAAEIILDEPCAAIPEALGAKVVVPYAPDR